jgi:hypothetical protein
MPDVAPASPVASTGTPAPGNQLIVENLRGRLILPVAGDDLSVAEIDSVRLSDVDPFVAAALTVLKRR